MASPKRSRQGRPVDSDAAQRVLEATFALAERDYSANVSPVKLPSDITQATEIIFKSSTQAYRDSLPSCVIARIVDAEIDISSPQTTGRHAGPKSFSGRSLWENVVEPFFSVHSIPASATPYLSSIRGGGRFTKTGAPRVQRDDLGFAALVKIISYLRKGKETRAREYLQYLLRRFLQFRDDSNIELQPIPKPNLDQLKFLVSGLLAQRSGGRLPALLVTALLQTVKECYSLEWDIEFQGINVADRVSGAVGDITIRKGEEILLGIEVTERSVDIDRVTSVFLNKVSPNKLNDYLFLSTTEPTENAIASARSYTGVGYEMNFTPWSRG